MIYILENTHTLGEDFLKAAVPLLSLQRLKKIDSMRISSDKINSAAVYLMLRFALKEQYGISEKPEFIYGEHGKPYLKDTKQIYFSLSHCRNACACIVSEKETAIDITDTRKISLRTAAYFCSKSELEYIDSLSEKNNELVKLWSAKECYSKLDGSGLSTNFKKIGKEQLKDIHIIKGEKYYLAYHSEKEEAAQKLLPSNLLYI